MASKLDHRIATAEGMYQAEVHKREKAEAALDAVKKRTDDAIESLTSRLALADKTVGQFHKACPDCEGWGFVRIAIDDAIPCENTWHTISAEYDRAKEADRG